MEEGKKNPTDGPTVESVLPADYATHYDLNEEQVNKIKEKYKKEKVEKEFA